MVVPPPAVQIGIAEIIEQSDANVLEKIEATKEASVQNSNIVSEPTTKVEFNDQNLKAAIHAFAATVPPSTSALVKMFNLKINIYDVNVAMHKSNINLIEPIKIEWQRFLRDYFGNREITLVITEDNTVIQQTKAYTQKEQLDEIIKENPLALDLLKKLNLKLK